MHGLLILGGLILVFVIVIHLIFRVVKFTFAALLLCLAFIVVVHLFRQYFGIDLIGEIARL